MDRDEPFNLGILERKQISIFLKMLNSSFLLLMLGDICCNSKSVWIMLTAVQYYNSIALKKYQSIQKSNKLIMSYLRSRL